MADKDDTEKTEQPTEKRLREAREKGQVPRSRELTSAAVVGAAGVCFWLAGGPLTDGAADWMRDALTIERGELFATEMAPARLAMVYFDGILTMTVPIIACMIAALVAPVLIGGFNFSNKALKPDFSKLNPIKGLGRVFSKNGLMELVKALAKFALVSLIAVLVLRTFAMELIGLGAEPGMQGMAHGLDILAQGFVYFSGALLLIAAFDAPFQLWQHTEQLKMSLKEVRDEMKESEGSPEVKSRVRQLQRQAAQAQMVAAVPGADVIVTNPTHFAVALKYDRNGQGAPKVVAKGADLLAATIRELGGRSKVPIVESAMLARALYHSVEVGQEIPAVLYKAVAQLLTYVFELQARRREIGRKPRLPKITVPEQMTRPRAERSE